MDFSGDVALWQRRIAEGLEGTVRRMAAFESLSIKADQSVLDIGCGGGHLVRQFALAVGDRGRAVGIDASSEQLETARTLCDGLPAAELVEGNATGMDFGNAVFDGLASINTLEYISDVDAALAEARRVLKPGAVAAIVSVLWDHFRFHGAEPGLTDRMLDAFRAHCPHQMLPMDLPQKLATAGFGGVSRTPLAFFNGALHENAYAYWVAKVVAAFAIGQGVPRNDTARWLTQLGEADEQGCFGFVSVPILTTAIAI
jgi:ubiquinone/menaquinone biosynthesis C-methylase UbiE